VDRQKQIRGARQILYRELEEQRLARGSGADETGDLAVI
jgi:hypothetical protein